MSWFNKLQHIDSKILYLLLAVVVALPLVINFTMPVVVTPAARGAYDAIEKLPADKLAIVDVYWAAGTSAENKPQTEAIIRHLFMRNKKFAVLAFDVQGSQFTDEIANRIGKEYGKVYGVDWVDWGYRPVAVEPLVIQGMAKDVIGSIVTDINGTPLKQIPIMKNVRTIKDIGLVAEITPAETIKYWISLIHAPYRTPLILAATSIFGPEGFNMLDAGQVDGLLVGMRGAAEYEKLLGRSDFATRGTSALSSSHLLIILLIVAGNIGYISSRRRRSG